MRISTQFPHIWVGVILDLRSIGRDYIPLIAQMVSRGDDEEDDFDVSIETLEVFFSHCYLIRNLRLQWLDLGEDPDSMSRIIKDGLSRLNRFDLIYCDGNVRIFIKSTPFPYLKKSFESYLKRRLIS
jgi:hypothetical protein